MKNKILSILFLLTSLFSQAQTKVNGITFPDTYMAGKDKLVFNGAGTREKYWMDMYVGGLYLTAKSKDAAAIVAANASMMARLSIVSGLITSAKMSEAVGEGFKKSTGGNTAPIKDKITQFQNAFLEPIKVGDVFEIAYTEEKTLVYKNSVLKTTIPGLDFKKALFGMWLGADPVSSDLKDGMLGIK